MFSQRVESLEGLFDLVRIRELVLDLPSGLFSLQANKKRKVLPTFTSMCPP
jgi:hypothetical protein